MCLPRTAGVPPCFRHVPFASPTWEGSRCWHGLDHGRHIDSAGSPGPVLGRGPPEQAQPRAGGWGSKDGTRGGELKRDRSVENFFCLRRLREPLHCGKFKRTQLVLKFVHFQVQSSATNAALLRLSECWPAGRRISAAAQRAVSVGVRTPSGSRAGVSTHLAHRPRCLNRRLMGRNLKHEITGSGPQFRP